MCLFNTVSQAYSPGLFRSPSPPPRTPTSFLWGLRKYKSALIRCSGVPDRQRCTVMARPQWPGLTHASLLPALLPRLALFLPPPGKDPWDTQWLDQPASGPPPTLPDSSCPCPLCLGIHGHTPESYKPPTHSLFPRCPGHVLASSMQRVSKTNADCEPGGLSWNRRQPSVWRALKLKRSQTTRLFPVAVPSLSRVRLFMTSQTAARQASLSITNSQNLLKLTSIDSVMPSSHLILCRPLLLLPPIPPSIRVISNESTLHIRWPKYCRFSFSINPFNEHPGLISFRMDWLDLLAVQGTLRSLLQHHSSKASILRRTASFTVQLSHPYMTTGKTIALNRQTFVGKVMSLLFNMLSGLVIAFLPKSKSLLISWL